jgi:hypothetical protein
MFPSVSLPNLVGTPINSAYKLPTVAPVLQAAGYDTLQANPLA